MRREFLLWEEERKKTVFISGGYGFIGIRLAYQLLKRDYTVILFDDRSRTNPWLEQRVEYLQKRFPAYLGILKGSVLSRDRLYTVLQQQTPRFAVHLVGPGSPFDAPETGEKNDTISTMGTALFVEAAKIADVERIIYVSSTAVYGNRESPYLEKPVASEDHRAYNKIQSTYGFSCLSAERIIEASELEHMIFRLSTAYGEYGYPGKEGENSIFNMIHDILQNNRVRIYGDGQSNLDLIYAYDVARALFHAVESTDTGVFNLGWGVPVSVNQVVDALEEVADRPFTREYLPANPNSISQGYASVQKMKSRLKFFPHIDLKTGLRRTYRFYRDALEKEMAGPSPEASETNEALEIREALTTETGETQKGRKTRKTQASSKSSKSKKTSKTQASKKTDKSKGST